MNVAVKSLISIIILVISSSVIAQDKSKKTYPLNKFYKKILIENQDYISSFNKNYIIPQFENTDFEQIPSYENFTFLSYETLKDYLTVNKLLVLNYLEISHKIISKDTVDINIDPKSVVLLTKKKKERKLKSDKTFLSFSGCGLVFKYEPDFRFTFDKLKNDWFLIE